jgi:hypothetical protein
MTMAQILEPVLASLAGLTAPGTEADAGQQ